MDLKVIHDAIDFFAEKSQLGYLSPEEKDAQLDRAQMMRFTELFSNPNEYGKGDGVSHISYAKSQKVHDSLLPFKKEATFTTGNFTSGVYTLPNDYLHLLSMVINYTDSNAPSGVNYETVDIISEDKWANRKKSQLIPASSVRPLGRLKNTTTPAKAIEMFPAQGYAGTFYYMKRPVKPVFAYTLVGRVITYNSGTSAQMEWDDEEINNVVFKAMQLLGINLQNEEVIGFFQNKDQAGV
ncbi:MAG: hypothetical protein WC756_22370 [Taibaiella sp.]|jgi:hypothetical protein